MTTLIVNIENEKDVPTITDLLNRPGVTYSVDEEYDEALEASLKQGLAEAQAGLGRPHSEVMAEARARLKI
jgi:predicted transcriptional regulator